MEAVFEPWGRGALQRGGIFTRAAIFYPTDIDRQTFRQRAHHGFLDSADSTKRTMPDFGISSEIIRGRPTALVEKMLRVHKPALG